MVMNRNHLALFLAVAEEGGFSRAAERLLISQPAVSLQVAELENALGLKLFDRLPRGVRLTEAGNVLLAYARRIAVVEAEADRAILELKGLSRGRLVVGASLTVGSYVLPPVFGEFHRRYPEVELSLEIVNTHEVQRRLVENSFDLGLMEGFLEAEELVSDVFHEDELVVIVPPGHALAKRRKVMAADVGGEPLILREVGSGTRAVVERALRAKGLAVKPVMSLGSTEAIKRAVVAGLGVAIVSSLAIGTELKAGELAVVPVGDLKIRRPLYRLELRGKERSPAAGRFLELLEAGVGEAGRGKKAASRAT
jgi:DNA-binding transcriptional LysR family regulator